MELKLIEYKDVKKDAYLNYIEEWENSGEIIVPSAVKRNNKLFEEMLDKWSLDKTDEVYNMGFVPSTLYFLINDESRILGAIHLRHVLNDRLIQNGGNIGYGVRPSERKKGYASIMLKMLLETLKGKGYNKVLLTCDDENKASARTIERNNGVLFDKPVFEGVLTRRYWINI